MVDDRTGATTRRRLLRLTAALATAAPLTALVPGGTAGATPDRRVRQVVLVPRFGGDPTSDWYPWLSRRLADLGVRLKVVRLLPEPTAPGVDQMVAAIAKAVGDDRAGTLLVGHSVGSRALLAYLSRHGKGRAFAGLVSVAGWFTVDDLGSYPALVPWVDLAVDAAAITAAAGPITVHLSDDDPFTADWRTNAGRWLAELGASVHLTPGAGHFMATTAPQVVDTIRAVGDRSMAR
ncbi:alpha/beta hydrolase [Umezawaea sp. NPDC059074]|uniref:alpha/beta hydrolase n=1 Tax=Umezawaea sp. NPDC059074 TaxID=3346716 RepID=UPI0036BB4DC7